MALFDDLKLGKDKRGNIKVSYLKKSLLVMNTNTMFEIIKDYSTKAFLTRVSKLVAPDEMVNDDDKVLAITLESTYTNRKRKFYSRKNIKNVGKTTNDFKYFINAVKILNEYDVTPKEFIESQIEGLSFVNNGNGTFPKPNQLANENSITRLLNYLHNDESSKEFKSQKLTHYDRTTPIMENATFVRYYNKIKDNTATLTEATFCNDVLVAVRGKSVKNVVQYIEKLND